MGPEKERTHRIKGMQAPGLSDKHKLLPQSTNVMPLPQPGGTLSLCAGAQEDMGKGNEWTAS